MTLSDVRHIFRITVERLDKGISYPRECGVTQLRLHLRPGVMITSTYSEAVVGIKAQEETS
jgi:hypothetical protein